MSTSHISGVRQAVAAAAHPLTGVDDYEPLLDLIGDARCVLIGEASHGTHEFYRERAEITKLLIERKGFSAVAVEADWPDAYRVSCYVAGRADDPDAAAALGGFTRFPTWMWRNTVVRDFVEWLRAHNLAHADRSRPVGFYGLDLYSLHQSMGAVIRYLESVDPDAAQRARWRYSCFDHHGEDPQAYGYAATFNLDASCEREVLAQLQELQQAAPAYLAQDGKGSADAYFYAEQNARLAKNAEDYYRTMFEGRVSSWNVRDCHMADTLDALIAYLDRAGGRSKVVLWAHNSHLGDARATEMGEGGELNVGQLVRERYGADAALVGFTTYTGTVTAASDWGDPPALMRVRPGLNGSYEALFHEIGMPRFLLDLHHSQVEDLLRQPRLERAIGVIYRPETERLSHYFRARLADQFDAVVHLDTTRALEPLEPSAGWLDDEPPETFPSTL